VLNGKTPLAWILSATFQGQQKGLFVDQKRCRQVSVTDDAGKPDDGECRERDATSTGEPEGLVEPVPVTLQKHCLSLVLPGTDGRSLERPVSGLSE
jgi:hypothetical protein